MANVTVAGGKVTLATLANPLTTTTLYSRDSILIPALYSNTVSSASIQVGGTLYKNGIFNDVSASLDTGSVGPFVIFPTFNVTVANGVVTALVLLSGGIARAYSAHSNSNILTVATNSTFLTISNTLLGGTGSGLKISILLTALTDGGTGATLIPTHLNNDTQPPIFSTLQFGNQNPTQLATHFPTSSNPNVYYPTCRNEEYAVNLEPTKMLSFRKDIWLLPSATYRKSYEFAQGALPTVVSVPRIDFQMIISDTGAMMLMKDYIYGGDPGYAATSGVPSGSHPIVQEIVGNKVCIENEGYCYSGYTYITPTNVSITSIDSNTVRLVLLLVLLLVIFHPPVLTQILLIL